MLRPQWILALLLALLVAAVFAWLGRWQMDNAIRTDVHDSAELETPRPLDELAEPGTAVTEAAAGAVVTVEGSVRADDLQIVAPRDNAGERGAWVVGHLVSPAGAGGEGSHLAVAIGWAPDVETAERVRDRLAADPELSAERELEGRFMPTEGPVAPDAGEDPSLIKSMVPAQLVNVWTGVDGPAHTGYLVLHADGAAGALLDGWGLDPIDSVAPEPPDGQLAQCVLRDRMGRVRGLRRVPVVQAHPRRLGEGARAEAPGSRGRGGRSRLALRRLSGRSEPRRAHPENPER